MYSEKCPAHLKKKKKKETQNQDSHKIEIVLVSLKKKMHTGQVLQNELKLLLPQNEVVYSIFTMKLNPIKALGVWFDNSL